MSRDQGQDSISRIHQGICLRYRSFKRGGVSEFSDTQSEDRSQATSFSLRLNTGQISIQICVHTKNVVFTPKWMKFVFEPCVHTIGFVFTPCGMLHTTLSHSHQRVWCNHISVFIPKQYVIEYRKEFTPGRLIHTWWWIHTIWFPVHIQDYWSSVDWTGSYQEYSYSHRNWTILYKFILYGVKLSH